MKQMTPLSKMSKKRQKAFHAQQRGSWNGLSPVTRVVPNKKAYDRNRARQAFRREKLPEECPARFLIAAPLRPLPPACGITPVAPLWRARENCAILSARNGGASACR